MTAILDGVRILEVAEHTFVPAASAMLSDLGADVIKIEHVERGDAMRGLASSGIAVMGGGVHALLEHSNRGKRSIGVDLTTAAGLDLVCRIAETCDVFLTNKMPSVRAKLNIGLDTIRAANPRIIYVRGTGQGERGPDADKGSYDSLAFWARSGASVGSSRPEYGDNFAGPPGPGFGDSIGALTIAGGILGALFHRERTGEATTVDVSLFGTGLWAMGQAIALSHLMQQGWNATAVPASAARNPLVSTYISQDGRGVALTCLQAGKYWAEFCHRVGRPELATDERFADHASLMKNGSIAVDLLKELFAAAPLAEWRLRLQDFTGQWAVVQDSLEASRDPQTEANGYFQDCESAAGVPFKLVTVPVQYNEEPAVPGRAPEFNEHGDEILLELGLDYDAIIDLRVQGVIA